MQSEKRTDDENLLEETLLGDPEIARTASEDPLFIFLKRWGRQLLVISALVVAGYFGANLFQKSYTDSMKRYADVFSGIRAEIGNLEPLQVAVSSAKVEYDKKSADAGSSEDDRKKAKEALSKAEAALTSAKTQITERLTALSDARSPYADLAVIYKGVAALHQDDVKAAREAFAAFHWKSLADGDPARFFAELAGLGLSGALLEIPADENSARALLLDLAGSGHFVQVSAAVRLARLPGTTEQKKEVLALLEKLASLYPEQAQLLDPEIKMLSGLNQRS